MSFIGHEQLTIKQATQLELRSCREAIKITNKTSHKKEHVESCG